MPQESILEVADREMTEPAKPAFSIVIPCYNEEHAILDSIETLQSAFPDQTDFEIIVVNDGSSDGSPAVLEQAQPRFSNLQVVHHDRNRGYGAALKTGIRHAASDWIVITDADGTYPHERLEELIALSRDNEMVVGARTAADAKYPFIRKIPKAFLRTYASWLAGRAIPDLNSGMRVFRRDLAERFFNILPDGFSFTTTITLAFLTNRYRVHYLPIGYRPRVGKSKIQPIRDTLRFLQLIVRTGTYFAPLRFFSPIILLLSLAFLVSLGYDLFVLNNLTDKTIVLLMFAMNTGFFALLADMIDKRVP